jgi:hypothetical protein
VQHGAPRELARQRLPRPGREQRVEDRRGHRPAAVRGELDRRLAGVGAPRLEQGDERAVGELAGLRVAHRAERGDARGGGPRRHHARRDLVRPRPAHPHDGDGAAARRRRERGDGVVRDRRGLV